MNTTKHSAPGEVGPWVILSWVAIAFLAYWLLPWIALDYGLTDSTMEELIDALAWKYSAKTFVVPVFLALLAPCAWIKFSGKGCGWFYTIASFIGIGSILLPSFQQTRLSVSDRASL